MSILIELRTFILADTAVQALIGMRYYPKRLPIDALFPAITATEITNKEQDSHNGFSFYNILRLQLTIYGLNYNAVHSLANAVLSRVRDYRGMLGIYRVDRIKVEDYADQDPGLEELSGGQHQRFVDLIVHYAVPR